jgi:radical SAM superfamily enzyme YgiQ (UPF0313 family)
MQNREKLILLLDELVKLNIKWGCQISIDIAKDKKLLNLMKKCGAVIFVIGFESLNRNNLKLMNKNVNIKADYEKAIRIIYSFDIMIYGTFILGYDFDKKKDFKEIYRFAYKNNLSISNFNPLMVMVGTKLYERYKNEKRLIYDKWWISDKFRYGDSMFYLNNMKLSEYKRDCYKIRKRFNSIFSIFKRFLFERANRKNFILYFILNIINRKEIRKKQGKKLG